MGIEPTTVDLTVTLCAPAPRLASVYFSSSIIFKRLYYLFFATAYVKSNTVSGDAKHARGVVLADIVRANIPVKNGVVHLIQRPLMVVDTTVVDFLKVSHVFNTKIVEKKIFFHVNLITI